MTASILSNAWRIYRDRFGLIAAVVLIVWVPCELLNSYLDAFVFGPDAFLRSFKTSQILDNFLGIIATAGVTRIALSARQGEPVAFAQAMGTGFAAWPRLWWTRILAGLAVVVAFLCLIVPGIYYATRLYFVETIAVVEGISGVDALKRSLALTENRFWQTFGFGVLLTLLILIPIAAVVVPLLFIPALEHWLINAGTGLVGDFAAAFSTVALLCGYEMYARLLDESDDAEQAVPNKMPLTAGNADLRG